jgi:mercuric ion transport protein
VVDSAPPRRSKVTGGLAVLACAACCAIPLLIAAGVLSGAGAAILEQTLLAVAAGLAVLALGTRSSPPTKPPRTTSASPGPSRRRP